MNLLTANINKLLVVTGIFEREEIVKRLYNHEIKVGAFLTISKRSKGCIIAIVNDKAVILSLDLCKNVGVDYAK